MDRVVQYALREWERDLLRNQLPAIIASVGPLQSVLQVVQGVRDLLLLPIQQYQKDRRLVRGLKKGATSFSSSTATALLDLTNRCLHVIEGAAQVGHDLLSPPRPHHRQHQMSCTGQQPRDLREGVSQAYTAVSHQIPLHFRQVTTAGLQADNRTAAIGAVVRELPSGIFLPLGTLAGAASSLVTGARNQLLPDARKEDQDKYKYCK